MGGDLVGEMGHEGNAQFSGKGIEGAQASFEAQAAGAPAQMLSPQMLQEIVRRVLVGVNEEGLSEFHIEFADDVLSGARLNLTARDGKITAKFFTPDKNTGRLLKASEGELARLFARKGLSLQQLEVESA